MDRAFSRLEITFAFFFSFISSDRPNELRRYNGVTNRGDVRGSSVQSCALVSKEKIRLHVPESRALTAPRGAMPAVADLLYRTRGEFSPISGESPDILTRNPYSINMFQWVRFVYKV